MKMLRLVAALVAWSLLAATAHARGGVPAANFENLPVVSATGQPATPAQIRAAIEAAAQPHGWKVTALGPDHVVASLTVRDKHTVVTDILVRPGQYSVKYKDSVNMNYDPATGLIHPKYNQWVQGLVDGIRTEAARR